MTVKTQSKTSARAEITSLLAEAGEIELRLQAVKKDAARKETIKDRLRDLCTAFPDLFEQATTLTKAYAPAGASAGVTVTYPEVQYDVAYERFRERVGDGVFHEVFEVTKAVLDLAAWAKVVAEERASEADMRDCTVVLPGRKAAVSIKAPTPVAA